jgi:hypothetical protein
MAAGRLSYVVNAPFGSGAQPELEYCRRVSAYLGLSLETIMVMATSGSDAERRRAAGLRPRRPKLLG